MMNFAEIKFYNLDTQRFVKGEMELEKECGGVAHAKAFTLASGMIVVVGSKHNFTEDRAQDAIARTVTCGVE